MQIDRTNNLTVPQGYHSPDAPSGSVKKEKVLSEETVISDENIENTSFLTISNANVDSDKIAKAKKMLAEGNLASEENIKEAAENILKFGL